MSKNKNLKNKGLFADNRITLVVSLLLAILLWIVIAGFIDPGNSIPIGNVLIDYTRNEADYKDQNLQIVGDIRYAYADVQIKGDGSVIGGINYNHITVYPDYSAVNGPGTFNLPLRAQRLTSDSFSFGGISVSGGGYNLNRNPRDYVTLTFEAVEKKAFPVTVKAEGISAAEGYFEDLPVSKPGEVILTGPKTEVERVAQVVAPITDEGEVTELTKFTGIPLVLLDKEGEELDDEELGISFSVDAADVEIPVYQVRDIGLTVNFTGLPTGIDSEWFYKRVHLSAESIEIVGSPAAFENLSNPYPIATFSAADLEMSWESEPIFIELPEGLRNLNQLKQVVVSLDTTDLVEKIIEVPRDNIKVVNGPLNAEIVPITGNVSVRLMGTADQINSLLPEDVIVQIDAFSISGGKNSQQTIPARVLVPGTDKVIVLGSYPVVCDVRITA